ncbi:MAG: molybdopterin molybdenumtransferase MoeA [Dehalococcoidia bacterium]|nr:molybdopterin molybdenumtransferase MoeA [Dehalococcoidia bacterium]
MSMEEALERMLGHFRALEAKDTPILETLGQVLAEDIYAAFDVPPMDNSAMDGYAVRASDTSGAAAEFPVSLDIIGQVAAGHLPEVGVEPGTAVRIMTGAPMPGGADTVVPFEDTDESQQRESMLTSERLSKIRVFKEPTAAANVRRSGDDVRQGALVLKAGTLIRPSEIGVMATLGLAAARVYRRPRVGILATGDELVEPGQPLGPGQIYDANSYSIASQVRQCGGEPVLLGIAKDNIDELLLKISTGLSTDFLITSAGVSTGEYDLVKDILTKHGWMDFWRVRMRPGKPIAFGSLKAGDGREIPHMGLPGNPVSSMIAFEQFARPAIMKMLGYKDTTRLVISAVLEQRVVNDDGRRFFARAIVSKRDGEYYARLTGPQGSNILTSMSRANGLIVIPEDVQAVNPGERVQVQVLAGSEDLLT